MLLIYILQKYYLNEFACPSKKL